MNKQPLGVRVIMEKTIRKYAGIMKELGITGLEVLDENDKRIRIELPTGFQSQNENVTYATPDVILHQSNGDNYYTVKSPMVGVFYAGPAENSEPFVAVNDRIENGTTLCIIESMKLMNEIVSEETGVIAEICVENGQLVEYGTELFKIKR